MADEKKQNDAQETKPEEKKLSRAEKKALKKKEKESKEVQDNEEEEKGSGKVVLFFVTLLIIVIWLGIIAILIKTDVGGFGSTVLYPVLKDVPYLNRILPATEENVGGNADGTETEAYPYDTLDEAIARIKELELELDSKAATKTADDATISDLQSQIQELSTYKEQQAAFEEEKEKFYEEVVFSDKAPDINEYKSYYESIDPANAEALYKQVVEQLEYDSEIEEYAKTYANMKPKEAAAVFDTMTDQLDLVAKIMLNMGTQSRADILGKMDPETAAAVTKLMEPTK